MKRRIVKTARFGDSAVTEPVTHCISSALMKDFLRPNLSERKPNSIPPTMTPRLKTMFDISGR